MGYDEKLGRISRYGRDEDEKPVLRIGLGSDWHIGAASDKQIKRCLLAMKEENPDILVLAGDFNGGWYGQKAVRSVLRLTREVFPDIKILIVLGNHDFWVRGRRSTHSDPYDPFSHKSYMKPSLDVWNRNYTDIIKHCKDLNVHFLDEDGVWRDPRWPGLAIFGHTMWYDNPSPPTNDARYMPTSIEGDTDAYMSKRAHKAVEAQLDALTSTDQLRIFVSHMPVMYPSGRRHGDMMYGGPESVGRMLWDYHNVRYFLNGHCHQRWECFPRFEAGSDYGNPRYVMVDVYDDLRQVPGALPSPKDTPSKA